MKLLEQSVKYALGIVGFGVALSVGLTVEKLFSKAPPSNIYPIYPPGNTLQQWMDKNGKTDIEIATVMQWDDRTLEHFLEGEYDIDFAEAFRLEHLTGFAWKYWIIQQRAWKEALIKGTPAESYTGLEL